jgi:RimJ/RimL family protein N-acetyltransferase
MTTAATPDKTPAPLSLPHLPLQGWGMRLQPYAPEWKERLRQALDVDPEAWDLFATSGQGEHFATWWSNIARDTLAGTWQAYAIVDEASGRVVGTSSFLNIKPARQSAEIGGTFLHPSVRATHVNPAAKLLMLQHAFDHGARRIELLTDGRNVRSQAAIAKLGAVREGVLRRDRITWTGHIRDSVVYGITDLDWPQVQARLQQRLQGRLQVPPSLNASGS